MWKLVRIWILSSWSFLTIGILLGSWWAYHELGWGGWWFWDPVENASLMPWLLATACIHSITKPKLNYWTLISTQATFILSILGTFFVRSGLLSSVHSFATDSTRAQALLFFLLSITSISVFNWISLCFKAVPPGGQEHRRKRPSFFYSVQKPVPAGGPSDIKRRSLEQILFLQNFYLSVICIVVFCGTSAPLLFHWLWNRNVGTGAPFYNATVVPLFTSVFFVLVYAHYIQFNSKSERTLGPTLPLVAPPSSAERSEAETIIKKTEAPSAPHHKLTTGGFGRAERLRSSNSLAPSSPLPSVRRSSNSLGRQEAKYKTRPRLLLWLLRRPRLLLFDRSGSFVADRSALTTFGPRLLLDRASNRRRLPVGKRLLYYCIFFFLLHVLIGVQLIGLNFLDSIYGAICILLISSIAAAPTTKVDRESVTRSSHKTRSNKTGPFLSATFGATLARSTKEPTESPPSSAQQSRHIVLTPPKLQFWIPWPPRNQLKFQSVSHGSSNIPNVGPRPDRRAPPPLGGWTSGDEGGPNVVRRWTSGDVRRQKCLLTSALLTSGSTVARDHKLTGGPRLLLHRRRGVVRKELELYGGPTPAAGYYPAARKARRRLGPFLGREAPVQMNVAHTGIVLFILGILLSNTFKLELTEQLHSGAPLGIRLGSQVCCLRSIDHSFAPTYHSICANLLVYQQVNNIDGWAERSEAAPFAHNLNLQMVDREPVRHEGRAVARRSSNSLAPPDVDPGEPVTRLRSSNSLAPSVENKSRSGYQQPPHQQPPELPRYRSPEVHASFVGPPSSPEVHPPKGGGALSLVAGPPPDVCSHFVAETIHLPEPGRPKGGFAAPSPEGSEPESRSNKAPDGPSIASGSFVAPNGYSAAIGGPQPPNVAPNVARLADARPSQARAFVGDGVALSMFPEKRFYYSNQGAIATKVAIHSNLFTDFYSLIGTGSFETGWFTTIMKLPFIFCIWLGFMFGVFGGALAVKKQLQKSKLFWL